MQNEAFLSNFQNLLKTHIYSWTEHIQGYAMNLFIILATIALIVNIILTILESGGTVDVSKISGFIIKFAFVTGFFFFLLQNGLTYANYIIDYFIRIGNESLGYGYGDKGAIENILQAIYKIWGSSTTKISMWQPAEYVSSILLAIFIIILLCIILGNYLVEVASSFILVYAGYLILAFGATQWTREWVINYFKAVLGIGLKILTLLFLIGITLDFLKMQLTMFNNGFNLSNGITILITLFIMMMIVNKVPDAVAALVSGAWGHMSGINMATAVAALMGAAQATKIAMSTISKAGSNLIDGLKNYKAGLDDSANEYIKNKFPNAANASTNQNDTFTPNNNNNSIPGYNPNTKNGSGISYWMGRGTGIGLTKLSEFKSSKSKSNDGNNNKKSSDTNSNNKESTSINNKSNNNTKNN